MFRAHPIRSAALIALAGAMAAPAGASFTGVSLENLGEVVPGLTTYRVHALFDDAADQAISLFGNADGVLLSYTTLSGDGTLYQAPGPDFDLPDPAAGPGDTWLALGPDTAGLGFTPGFGGGGSSPFFAGDDWGYIGGIIDTDLGTPITGGSILIGQFTLDSAATAEFAGNIAWIGSAGGGGGGPQESSFSVVIPGPGSLALLGLAGLAGRRRRRD